MGMQSHSPFAPLIIKPVLAKHDRNSIERQIEELIAMLDDLDGDCDLEDDEPSATPIDQGEAEGDFGRGLLPTHPIYCDDQTAGPINHRQAAMAYSRAEREGW